VTYLPVDRTGRIDPDDLRRAITPRTILISIMHANNEVGTIEPIEDCARIAHERRILFHTDAAQSVGKVSTDVNELGVDLLSVAGHKVYAPKGVGALFVRRGVRLESLIHGAAHEAGRRAGTESALLAVGLGKACELACDLAPIDLVRALRDHFWQELEQRFGDRITLNGHPTRRLPNTLNVSFVGQIGTEILARPRWRCRHNRIGMSFGPDRVVAGSGSHARRARSRHGCNPLQPWTHDLTERSRRSCRTSD
jgi:cysteine desulfurase